MVLGLRSCGISLLMQLKLNLKLLNKVDTIILACYCPLSITLYGKMIWENPVPNGVAYARPVTLICGKEERSLLQEEHQFWEPYLGEYSVNVTHQDGQVKVTFNTECSMVDGKMVSLLQGDSGAYRHCCTVTKDEGNSLDAIENGVRITKDFQTCMETWEQLESGNIPYSSKDRQGQCHQPITTTGLKYFSNL